MANKEHNLSCLADWKMSGQFFFSFSLYFSFSSSSSFVAEVSIWSDLALQIVMRWPFCSSPRFSAEFRIENRWFRSGLAELSQCPNRDFCRCWRDEYDKRSRHYQKRTQNAFRSGRFDFVAFNFIMTTYCVVVTGAHVCRDRIEFYGINFIPHRKSVERMRDTTKQNRTTTKNCSNARKMHVQKMMNKQKSHTKTVRIERTNESWQLYIRLYVVGLRKSFVVNESISCTKTYPNQLRIETGSLTYLFSRTDTFADGRIVRSPHTHTHARG